MAKEYGDVAIDAVNAWRDDPDAVIVALRPAGEDYSTTFRLSREDADQLGGMLHLLTRPSSTQPDQGDSNGG